MAASVLIVDDDKLTRDTLAQALSDGYQTRVAASSQEALSLVRTTDVDVLLADLVMPGMDGIELMRRATEEDASLATIIITGHGTIESAVRAMKEGAYDYITKPINLDRLGLLIEKALEHSRLKTENMRLKDKVLERYAESVIVGNSAAMRRVLDQVHRVADTHATVLIEGETGTGKELIANILHYHSPRALGPFVKVNCAALAQGVVESELFGHERGAFTGARVRRKGRFALADGGTLFIDEVGDLPPEIQVKVLRFLQERTFERVGGHHPEKVDVRVIAATNRRLEDLVAEGKFREDLYYRLCVVKLPLPPLRERRDDIVPLVEHFLHHFCETHDRRIEMVDGDVRELLRGHPWPGNVRELMNCMESMVVNTTTNVITVDSIPDHLFTRCDTTGPGTMGEGLMEEMERKLVRETLEKTNGDKTRAAAILGIGLRTLYRKLDKWKSSDG